MSATDKENVEKELAVLKQAVTDKDIEKMKSGMESLQKVSHKLAEEMYKATAAQSGAGADAGAAGAGPDMGAGGNAEGGAQGDAPNKDKKDDVIDADFKASSDK